MDFRYNWVEWMPWIGGRMCTAWGFFPSDDLQDEIQQVDVHGFGSFLLLIMKDHFGATSAKWNFLGVQKQQATHAIRCRFILETLVSVGTLQHACGWHCYRLNFSVFLFAQFSQL
ncbi:hypothetical protein V6N13_108167 [Hibiscus sabdariffa]|uniref:Uncharacterized protein n=1 Tax=Hibiscus sabdariffa TaxID=183260 RepID=A0ABR2SRI1_9ROSI